MGVAGFTAFLMMGMGGSYQRKVCGYALEDGYQAWQKYDPRRGS